MGISTLGKSLKVLSPKLVPSLDPWAFKRLNEVACNTFYKLAPYYTWYDFRVLAVDGSRLVLPNHPSVITEFGQHSFGPKADSPRSLALASMLYDISKSNDNRFGDCTSFW